MKEIVVTFGPSRSLGGVVCGIKNNNAASSLPAFIFLNSGVIHRVGPNRLSVRMARKLASMGFPSLRFDLSGIGDSRASRNDLSVHERWPYETKEAMNFLKQEFAIDQFILIGNCSGAGTALATASDDTRVKGAVLVNPQGSKNLFRYYLRLAMFCPNFWRRILSGKLKLQSEALRIREQFKNTRQLDSKNIDVVNEIAKRLEALIGRGANILIVHCEWDPGWAYFKAKLSNVIRELRLSQKLKTEIIYGVNHDFNILQGQEDLIDIVCSWASKIKSTS